MRHCSDVEPFAQRSDNATTYTVSTHQVLHQSEEKFGFVDSGKTSLWTSGTLPHGIRAASFAVRLRGEVIECGGVHYSTDACGLFPPYCVTQEWNVSDTAVRNAELRQVLSERRRDMQHEVQSRSRGGRTERPREARDDLEHSEADIQDGIGFALLQIRAETLTHIDEALVRSTQASTGPASSAATRFRNDGCERCRSRRVASRAKKDAIRSKGARNGSLSDATGSHSSLTRSVPKRTPRPPRSGLEMSHGTCPAIPHMCAQTHSAGDSVARELSHAYNA